MPAAAVHDHRLRGGSYDEHECKHVTRERIQSGGENRGALMCFSHDDYEWTAEISETAEGHSANATRCIECGAAIAAGEFRRNIWQQEHECCQLCQDEWSDSYDESIDKATCEHEDGETFDADTCAACCKLLTAVRSVELDEGCPEDSQVPRIGELCDALIEIDDGEKYARRAVEMFPELATHRIVLAIAKKGGDTR